MVAALVALWVIVMALVWWWWASSTTDDTGEGPPPADPYAAQVDAFRAQLHDWDRRGGHGG